MPSSRPCLLAIRLLVVASLAPAGAGANPGQHAPQPRPPAPSAARPKLPPSGGVEPAPDSRTETGPRPERSGLEWLDETPPEGEGDVPGWLSRKRRWREEATRARNIAQEALRDADAGAVPPSEEEARELQEALGYASEEMDLADQAAREAEARHAAGEPWTELQDGVEDLIREGRLLDHYESAAARAEHERREAERREDVVFWAERRDALRSARDATLARYEDAKTRAREHATTDAEREVVVDLIGRIGVLRTLEEIAASTREAWRRLRGGDANRADEADAISGRTRAEASGAASRFHASAVRARVVAAGQELDHATELEAARLRKEQVEREYADIQRRFRELPFDASRSEYYRLSQETSRLAAETQIAETDYQRAVARADAAGFQPAP